MVRSTGEVRKPVRWPRTDRAQRLRLLAESRGEDRPHKRGAALSLGQCSQPLRALPRTAPQIDPCQPEAWESPALQIPAAQPRLQRVALLSRAEIFRQSSDPKRVCVRSMADA